MHTSIFGHGIHFTVGFIAMTTQADAFMPGAKDYSTILFAARMSVVIIHVNAERTL